MNESPAIAQASVADGVAVEIVLDDVGGGDESGRQGARKKIVLGIGRVPHTDVPIAIQDAFRRQDVIRRDQIVDQRLLVVGGGRAGGCPGGGGRGRRGGGGGGGWGGWPWARGGLGVGGWGLWGLWVWGGLGGFALGWLFVGAFWVWGGAFLGCLVWVGRIRAACEKRESRAAISKSEFYAGISYRLEKTGSSITD